MHQIANETNLFFVDVTMRVCWTCYYDIALLLEKGPFKSSRVLFSFLNTDIWMWYNVFNEKQ